MYFINFKKESFVNNAYYNSLYKLSNKSNKSFKNHIIKPNDKFIIFNYDMAGFNNVRISFEIIIIITKYLDRILVIPPRTDSFGGGHIKGSSSIFDFYSLKNLSQYINICTYDKLDKNIKNIDDLFKYAKSSRDYYFYIEDTNTRSGCLLYDKQNLTSIRDDETINLKKINQKFLCLFSSLDEDYIKKMIPNYQFKNIKHPRFLFNYEYYFRMNLGKRKELYRWLYKALKIRKIIISETIKILKKLSLSSYNAVHIRSNDFKQFNKNFNLEEFITSVKIIFSKKKKLLIITDHDNINEIINSFSDYKVYTSNDFYHKIEINFKERCSLMINKICQEQYISEENEGYTNILKKYHGLIESLLCVLADKFIGSSMSTFSQYIQVLRGYMSKYHKNINTDLIYTSDINPIIDKKKFQEYQHIKPNNSSTNCHIWYRISNNMWKYI